MEYNSKYPGSFGEVLQGNFKGKDILVSFPINLYTNVKIFKNDLKNQNVRVNNLNINNTIETNNIRIFRKNFKNNKFKILNKTEGKIYSNIKYRNNFKASMFMKKILENWGYSDFYKKFHIEIKSQIPKGKGLASSTADICATYKVLTKIFNKPYLEEELTKFSLEIEPTDSIIFDKFNIFDYKYGKYKEEIGEYIKFYILAFEGNRIINTVNFNKKNLPSMEKVDDLVPILKEGILKKDIDRISYVSTESIIRNLHRVTYSYLDFVIDYKNRTYGSGIIGAHSGNALGIIYKDKETLNKALKGYKPYGDLRVYPLESVTFK
ncbi:kinase [Clostridium oceanicum]|uniref:Kinase n=1 Tax=Clostridium oceanicum TaxID=1543 RepID=A0ABN1JGT7_9CLOT